MDQNYGNGSRAGTGGQTGSEDASRAQQHVQNAEENRDALEAQSRRVESTTPAELQGDSPRTGGTGGMSASGTRDEGSEDPTQAQRHVENVERNRDALEAQSRRVEETAPAELQGDSPRTGGTDPGGMSAGRQDQGSEDPTEAQRHVENVERNRDALEAQNRRVEETAPDHVREDLRDR